jgi:hypothetical protein
VPVPLLAGEGEVRFRKLAESGWKAILNTIAVLLLTQGANSINSGDYLTGGAMCVIGFILFLIANYS